MPSLGTLQRLANFESQFISLRHVNVWLPPDYSEHSAAYPVIYMHDGQNLFDPATATLGIPWGIHEVITRLMNTGKTRGAIVIGIWNSEFRKREYMPQKVYESSGFEKQRRAFIEDAGGEPMSDAYLKFIVQELKPFIDSKYRTLPEQPNTFMMGSSRGGLISLYAVSEYPDIFYGAGCLSTHWSAGEHELVNEMAKALPDPKTHRLYFDYGTEGLDAAYEPYQNQMDEYLRKAGYMENQNWLTRKFEGADHNETAWHARVEIPLSFLLA